ncbi:hypothetical protein HYH02_009093 [Chlamydomonas schloesseri]|uniref:Uncharacterized protein n=1 Tax=Chlamydomonas schloesseri TaxID=2026947 RepID=A0A835WB80_9CHLO|nr:hypothetical protein HYH02_009093 [Chlamydomonas schloesseri]|eukprot:KAG2444154.1 hypothetical protein HYH02_009093 [Chlamydomonas schloesseri]
MPLLAARVDSTEGTASSHCGSKDEDSCYSPKGLRALDWSGSDCLRDALCSPSDPGPRAYEEVVPPWSDSEPSLARRAHGATSFATSALSSRHSVTTVTPAQATNHTSPFFGQQYSQNVAAAAAADGSVEGLLPEPVSGSLLSCYLAARPSAGAAPSNTCARMVSRLHRSSINGIGSISNNNSGTGDGGGGGVSGRARQSLTGARSMGAVEASALGLKHAFSLSSSFVASPAAATAAAAAGVAAPHAPATVSNSPGALQRRATDSFRTLAADEARPAAPVPGERRLPRVPGSSSFASVSTLEVGAGAGAGASPSVPASWSPPTPPSARTSQSSLQQLLQQPSMEVKLPALLSGGPAGASGGAASYRASGDGSGSFRGMRPRAPAHSLFTDTKEELAAAAAAAQPPASAAPAPAAPAPAPASSSSSSSSYPSSMEGKAWALRTPSLKSAVLQPAPRRSVSGVVAFINGAAEVAPPRTAVAAPAAAASPVFSDDLRVGALASPPPAPPPAPPLRGTRSVKYLGAVVPGGGTGSSSASSVSSSVSPLYAGFGASGYGYAHSCGGASGTGAGGSSVEGCAGGVGGSAVAAVAAAGSRSAAALLAGARELRQLSSRVVGSALAAADAAERRAGLAAYS